MSEILDQAERIDREEDERYGQARGDELPEPLRTRDGRRAALAAARERLQRERSEQRDAGEEVIEQVEMALDPEQFVTRSFGRRTWFRESRRALDRQREIHGRAIPRSRGERLDEAKRRLDEELAVEHAANRCYEAYRAGGVMKDGRWFGGPPLPHDPPLVPEGKINTTDPDSRIVRTQGQPAIQG